MKIAYGIGGFVLIAIVVLAIADRWLRAATVQSLPAAPTSSSPLFAPPLQLESMVTAPRQQRTPWTTTVEYTARFVIRSK